VLFDVYVRSCLTFAAPVWSPQALAGVFPRESQDLHCLHVLHRRGLRAMLGVARDVRNSVLHAVACRAPLTLPLAKATWRYFKRVVESEDEGYMSVLKGVCTWAR
jgi:hypothetical protein